jgi:hypothetical protein
MSRFKIALSVIVSLEFLIAAAIFFQTGFSIVSLYTLEEAIHILTIAVFSVIFIVQNKHVLFKILSPFVYTLFSILYGTYFLIFAISHATRQRSFLDLEAWLSITGLSITIVLAAIEVRAYSKQITAHRFYLSEQVFAYFIWATFFVFYYTKVEGTSTQITTSHLHDVIILAWVSSLLGYRFSRLVTLNPFKRRNKKV